MLGNKLVACAPTNEACYIVIASSRNLCENILQDAPGGLPVAGSKPRGYVPLSRCYHIIQP